MTNLPLPDEKTVRPFAYSDAQVSRIAAGLSGYVLFILCPAYGLLRGWWLGDFSSFSVEGPVVAVAILCAFGFFARWTILKYLWIDS